MTPPFGLPAEALFADTLWELVELRAAATPEALFARDEAGRAWSFATFRDEALALAGVLAARGVGAGTPVSWILPTRLEALALCGALARLGAVQNPILPIYREREVGFVTRQADTRLLCVPSPWRGFDYPAMARELGKDAPDLDVLVVDASLTDAPRAALPPFEAPAASDTVRWLFYTSGTTADPKGAKHADAGLLATFTGMVRTLGLDLSDRHAFVFPLTHVGGVGWLMAGLMAGCAHLVVESFDPETTVPFLAEHGVTQAGAGTVFHQAYLAAQRASREERLFPAIRSFPGGGAPKPPDLHRALRVELGGAGIVSGYGLTECPIIAMNAIGDPDTKLADTEGRVNPPGAEIRVVTLDGRRAGAGEEGELRVRGPQLCQGYVDPSLDADAFDAQGFFRTGDLGYLDADGFVVITGRLKDVIIRKGENISAKELEDRLHAHPAVAEVAVVGLPDPGLGERCCAVVVREPGEAFDFDAMTAWLEAGGLMRQKFPEQLEDVSELPRNPTGKVLKQELRQRFG